MNDLGQLTDEMFGLGFRPALERIADESTERLESSKHRISFGNTFLDDYFGGIMQRDLVLVGAYSGAGKTQLTVQMALHACQQGKRVYFFALEAEQSEIERRLKYQILADLYASQKYRMGMESFDFQNWCLGELEAELAPLDGQAQEEMAKLTKGNLFTFYRGKDFDVTHLQKNIHAHQSDADLFILDHFHYIDTDNSQNENRASTALASAIRDTVLAVEVPVIVVAHLRKRDRYSKNEMPTLDDFHGTSNLVKISTKAILLHKGEYNEAEPTRKETYFMAPKNRTRGECPFVARMFFDVTRGHYLPGYELGFHKVVKGQGEFQPLKGKKPKWAKDAI